MQRKIRQLTGILAILFLAGCASSSDTQVADNEAYNSPCPEGFTLTCTERMGRQQQCTCNSREALHELLEPLDEGVPMGNQ